MIIPASSATAMPVAYSGGTPSTSQPAFGAALNARLAELQAVAPGLVHHHHDGSRGTGNQDAGNDPAAGGLTAPGLGTAIG